MEKKARSSIYKMIPAMAIVPLMLFGLLVLIICSLRFNGVMHEKVEDELKNKLIVLNSIIKGLEKLSEELVLNISQVDTESDDEIDHLFDEFKRATRSVSAYE